MSASSARLGWQVARLGEMISRVQNPVSVEPQTLYREIGIRSHGKGIFYKDAVTGESLGDKRVFWVEPGCFVVNIVFAWEGAVAQTTEAETGMIASHRFPMYRPASDVLDLNFLTYFFKSKRGIHMLGLASPGGAGRNKTLGQQEFLRLEIPLPPLAEQRKIADILSTWDAAIHLTEQLIAALQRRKQGLMQRLLTGQVRFAEFGDDWKMVNFADVLNIALGRTPARNRSDYWDNEKRSKNVWLSIADLNQKYIADSKEYISDLATKECGGRRVPAGTVVMSFKLTIGRAAIVAAPAFTNEAICSLIPMNPEQLDNEYLYYALSVVQFGAEIDQAVKGNTLNMAKIARLNLWLPGIKEQRRIAAVLRTCDEELALHQQKLAALRRQKQGLMQRLLTGAVRVNVAGG